MTRDNVDLWNVDTSYIHDIISISFMKLKKIRLQEVTVRLFTSVYCCVGRPVYGPTSLFHLQKRSLIAEIVRFFTAIQHGCQ